MLGFMSTPLVTLDALRVWTRDPIQGEADVAFAEEVIEAVKIRIEEELDFPDWLETADHAGTRSARQVAMQVARRAYLNPNQETRAGDLGPLGGASYLDDFARGLELTEAEVERLASIAGKHNDSANSGFGVLSIQRADPVVGARRAGRDIYLTTSRGSEIPYASEEDADAFTPLDPDEAP